MRLFWTFILILIAGGAAAAWWQSSAGAAEKRLVGTNVAAAAEHEVAPAPPLEPPAPASAPTEAAAPASPPSAMAEPPPDSPGTVPPDAPVGDPVRSFDIRGRGSDQDPFRVGWDLLLSAKDTYDPPAGKREMPKQITMLNGATVRITGYFAAPIGEESTSELLVMLNKWDGCCLGLPPTPYDAVEVRLAEPVRLTGQHVVRYGTVTGRFAADPFLVADFIMGLYRIEDARVEWGG